MPMLVYEFILIKRCKMIKCISVSYDLLRPLLLCFALLSLTRRTICFESIFLSRDAKSTLSVQTKIWHIYTSIRPRQPANQHPKPYCSHCVTRVEVSSSECLPAASTETVWQLRPVVGYHAQLFHPGKGKRPCSENVSTTSVLAIC